MIDFFFKTMKDVLSTPLEINCSSEFVTKPHQNKRQWPFIVRFHKFLDKDTVLLWANEHKDISYQGHSIKIYKDFIVGIARKCAAFNESKSVQEYADLLSLPAHHPKRWGFL